MRIKSITVCRITPTKSTAFDNAVSDAAEDIADRDFHLPFNELPNHLRMKVWQDAEATVRTSVDISDIEVQLSLGLDEPKKGVQLLLHGVFTGSIIGCPHYVAGKCSDREMQICSYEESPRRRCEVMIEVIRKWKEEFSENAQDRPVGSPA